MRMRLAAAVALTAALIVGCSRDGAPRVDPTAPQLVPKAQAPGQSARTITPGTCTTIPALQSLVNAVFGTGSPNANSALGKLGNLQHHVDTHNWAAASSQAFNLNTFVLSKYRDPTHPLPGSAADLVALINGVFCYAGLEISITDASNSWITYPTDNSTLVTGDGHAGVVIPPGSFSEPTVIVASKLPDDYHLNTKLDQYPGFYAFSHFSESGAPLAGTVTVAVCPNASVGETVRARLRLGHDRDDGHFEVTPPADASFLDCSTSTSQQPSHLPAWAQRLASIFVPHDLQAAPAAFLSGGVGGTAGSFSPFGPVDTELSFSGGVGGTAGSFMEGFDEARRGGKTGKSLPPMSGPSLSVAAGSCATPPEAAPEGQLDAECRPQIVVTTHNGTPLGGVPVAWAVTSGGGSGAEESGSSCGTFSTTVAAHTDASGKSRLCWTLGSAIGENTARATPSAGGDAPVGVSFVPASASFTAMSVRRVPVVTATGEAATFDGLAHGGSGACSDALTPVISYAPGGSVLPVNAGTYTLTVTCGDGGARFVTTSGTATITISPAATSTTLTCPATVVYTSAPATPCSASVTGPAGLAASVAVTYGSNVNVGTAVASATYAGGGNYLGSSASGTFQITPAATVTSVACPASLTFTGAALTPCTATVSGPGGLNASVAVTYASNVNVGTASAAASYAGGGNYLASTGTGSFQITPAATTVSLSCPVSVLYTGAPVTPCTATVSGPGLSQDVVPTYVNNLVGTATATATFAARGNYAGSSASRNFQILYVQSGCFASPIYSVMPSTKSSQKKGSNLPVKCVLLSASGVGVVGATGNILVEDLGIAANPDAAGTTAFSLSSAFRTAGGGSYSYGLDTSPSTFISLHYYRVRASWNDGSTTTGFFYVK